MLRILAIASLILASCATSMVPRSSADAEVIAYVNRAAELVADTGAAACSTFRQPGWFSSGWYVFIFDGSGRTVCHPARPQMVGTMASELVDASGVHFGNAFMKAADAEGGGWVSYQYARPGGGDAPVPKRSFVRAVMHDGARYVVGSGSYDVP